MIDRVTDFEESQRDFELEFAKGMEKAELQKGRLDAMQVKFDEMSQRTEHIQKKLDNIPDNLAKIGQDLAVQKNEFTDMMGKAKSILEKMENSDTNSEELKKLKLTCETNSSRLDKIQKDSWKCNLLVTKLPVNLHHPDGFIDFCFNEFNVEISKEDITYFTKIYDSPIRIVHLVRFRGIDSRNAVYRARANLGYRSRVWLHEDLVPHKEQLALGARRRFRVGKILKNWTYQGDVFILHKEDSKPQKITKEEDFPPETSLEDGEGMLLRIRPNRNIPRLNPMNRRGPYTPIRRHQRPPFNQFKLHHYLTVCFN